jgi:hypothetical protein
MSGCTGTGGRKRAIALGAVAVYLACALFALPGRAAATGDANMTECPSNTISSPGMRTYLPDCRAYEMVTPPDKAGARVTSVGVGAVSLGQTVSADGSSIAGQSTGAFAGLLNDELPQTGYAYYRFDRTSSGWVTTPLQQSRAELRSIGGGDSVWQSVDLGLAVPFISRVDAAGQAHDIGAPWAPALGATPLPVFELQSEVFEVEGAASQGQVVVFSVSPLSLFWPFDSSHRGPSLYEYSGTNNPAPALVGVSGGAGSFQLVSQCGTVLGSASHGALGFLSGGESRYNAISESGQTVYFTAAGADAVSCSGMQPSVNELFARIGAASTVAISEPTSGDCPSCDTSARSDAHFEGAAADGSKSFFTTSQALLGADISTNLYEFDFSPPPGEPKVVRVSSGASTAGVQGVTRISQDGSHVYFVARGVLTSEPDRSLVAGQQVAREGADNLYVYERNAHQPQGHTAFIADLCSEAEKSGAVADPQCPASLGPGGELSDAALWGGDSNRPAQATPDGRHLTFTSYADLTPDDASSAAQVFEFDAQAGSLVRVSKGDAGFNNDGNAALVPNSKDHDATITAQNYAGVAPGGATARTMSDDGSYVFFQSPIGLTPNALDSVPLGLNVASAPAYAQNVYEYHQGHVYLISDGADVTVGPEVVSNVHLIGASPSGADAFFMTGNQLVPQDTDTQVDFYDARAGGGFPAPKQAAACKGEECRGPTGPAPSLASPTSVGTPAGGNVGPPAQGATPKPRTNRAAKLAIALKACNKKPRRHRAACRRLALKRYGGTKKAKGKR